VRGGRGAGQIGYWKRLHLGHSLFDATEFRYQPFLPPSVVKVLVTWLDASPDYHQDLDLIQAASAPAPASAAHEACHISLRLLLTLANDFEALATLDR